MCGLMVFWCVGWWGCVGGVFVLCNLFGLIVYFVGVVVDYEQFVVGVVYEDFCVWLVIYIGY